VSGAGVKQATRFSSYAMLAASLAALAVLVGLGLWQLQRRAEKGAFLDRLRIESKTPAREGWRDEGELARLRVTGEFIGTSEAYVRVTLSELGLALYAIAPMRLADGRVILVNRGAVRALPDGTPLAHAPPPSGQVTLTGFRRAPERRWWFSPPDAPAKLIFAVRDPALIGRALGLAVDESAMLEQEREAAVPAGPGRPLAQPLVSPLATDAEALIARIPDNHLHYALTWFGLALTLVGVMVTYLIGRRRQG
jgi:surfeit locus 1 family protein